MNTRPRFQLAPELVWQHIEEERLERIVSEHSGRVRALASRQLERAQEAARERQRLAHELDRLTLGGAARHPYALQFVGEQRAWLLEAERQLNELESQLRVARHALQIALEDLNRARGRREVLERARAAVERKARASSLEREIELSLDDSRCRVRAGSTGRSGARADGRPAPDRTWREA